jgi:hypothetical protein
LTDETDCVRIEIEAALAKKIPVIPVLIDGAALPAPADLPEGLRNLAFRQAAPVDSALDFHPHMDRLIKADGQAAGDQSRQDQDGMKRRKSAASREQRTRPRRPSGMRRRYRCRPQATGAPARKGTRG